MEHFSEKILAADGKKLHLNHWNTNEKPKAIIQLVHGMAEHTSRYERFAKHICKNGYSICGHDQRGHGLTLGPDDVIGHVSNDHGWGVLLQDIESTNQHLRIKYPNIPIILFGHSMGAILSVSYLQAYGQKVDGWILSALAYNQGFMTELGISIADIQAIFFGKISRAKLHNALSFGAFNSSFKPNRTTFDWLSRDEAEVDKYINDPLCGEIFSAQFFRDLLWGVKNIYKAKNLLKVPRDIPLLMLAGSQDPVVGKEKEFVKTLDLFSKIPEDFSSKIYPEGRHEMLNETNRQEVFDDISTWLNQRFK